MPDHSFWSCLVGDASTFPQPLSTSVTSSCEPRSRSLFNSARRMYLRSLVCLMRYLPKTNNDNLASAMTMNGRRDESKSGCRAGDSSGSAGLRRVPGHIKGSTQPNQLVICLTTLTISCAIGELTRESASRSNSAPTAASKADAMA